MLYLSMLMLFWLSKELDFVIKKTDHVTIEATFVAKEVL